MANSTNTTHTELSCAAAWAQSASEVMAMPTLVTMSSFRRSTASATAPPHSPKMRSGTSPTAPASPT